MTSATWTTRTLLVKLSKFSLRPIYLPLICRTSIPILSISHIGKICSIITGRICLSATWTTRRTSTRCITILSVGFCCCIFMPNTSCIITFPTKTLSNFFSLCRNSIFLSLRCGFVPCFRKSMKLCCRFIWQISLTINHNISRSSLHIFTANGNSFTRPIALI